MYQLRLQSNHKIPTPHFSACGLMPPSQVVSPRLQFAFVLTVEQISQCSGWQLAQRGVESTKTIQSKNNKTSMVLWKGRSQKRSNQSEINFEAQRQRWGRRRRSKPNSHAEKKECRLPVIIRRMQKIGWVARVITGVDPKYPVLSQGRRQVNDKPRHKAKDEDQDETTYTIHLHNHFNLHDSRSARFGSAGVW